MMAFAMIMFCIGNVLLATMPVEQTYWIQNFLSSAITVWVITNAKTSPSSIMMLNAFSGNGHELPSCYGNT
jgi:hypothetical protein